MTDRQSQTPKEPSKGFLQRPNKWLKKKLSRPRSRSTSPQPSASGGIGASAAQDHGLSTQLSRSQPSSSPGLFVSAVAHDQHTTPTQDRAGSASPTQPHGTSTRHSSPNGGCILTTENVSQEAVGDLSRTRADPDKPTDGRAPSKASTVKDTVWSFTNMLLKRLPDAVDPNPAKIAVGIIKIVLQIKDEVKGNLDTVDKRILSTVDQLRTVEEALAGWRPNTAVEKQGIELYKTTLETELMKLIELKKQSFIRKIAVHEDDKGKIADIFERINNAREQLVVVTGLGAQKTVLAIQEDLVKLLLDQLEPSHAADHKSELEGEQWRLLRRAVCTPGTRVRILSDIARWANDTSSESQSVYWLSGQAGSGKSTIAHTSARRFEFAGDADDTIVLGGNFFCSRQINEARSATRIVRTIVYHLALRCKPFADALNRYGNFNTVYQSAHAQLESLLIKPWKQIQFADSLKSPCFLIIIDALDEIDGTGGSEFLCELLDSINKNHLQGLKFFVTSRPDPNLVTHLESFENKQFCHLEQVPIGEAQADIATYLDANLPDFVGHPEMEKLLAQTAGLFIYAATIVKYLADYEPLEQKERLDALYSVSDSIIQKTISEEETLLLDSLYLQVLSDALQQFKGNFFAHRLQILHTFLCTAERTSISVVAELLFPLNGNETNPAFSYTRIADSVLTRLHAVLYTKEDKVLSYHKSFTDFMFNQNRAKKFWCDQTKHHRLLTNSCFRVMKGLKFNIANIESSFLLDCENSALPEAVKQNITPVLSYSCRNWDYHLSAVASTALDPLYNTLQEFIKLHGLFWIEAMNLLESRGLCDQILQIAHEWVGKSQDKSLLAEYLTEARSFALYFSGSGAAASTPHLYLSALATWPQNSEPCQGWRSYFPGIPGFTNAFLGGTLLMTLKVDSWVQTVAISPDGKYIASGSYDKSVWIWDASTGNKLKKLMGHKDRVTSVAFAQDSKHIVSGSYDESVRIWDVSTGNELKKLIGYTNKATSVAFSPDSKHIVSGSYDNSVQTWDASTGIKLKEFWGHTNRITSVAFSPDSKHIVSGSYDKSVRIWDASTGNMLKKLKGHTHWVTSVAFSPDSKNIVSGSYDESVCIWNASTSKKLKELKGHTNKVISVAFSPNGKHIVSGSHDESVRIWDASTGNELKELKSHTNRVISVAFSPDSKHIISGSHDESVRIWDASTGKVLQKPKGHTSRVTSVAFSPDGKHIVSGSDDKSVCIWDVSTGNILKELKGHTNKIISVAFSPDGKHIVSGSHDESVRIWDTSTGNELKELKDHTNKITPVAFSPDGKYIISGSDDKSMWIWDSLTGNVLQKLEGHTDWVTSVAFSPNGRRIVSGSYDKSVRIWHTPTGTELRKFKSHTDWVTSVAFSPDGEYFVSGSYDKFVQLWDASTGNVLKKLRGHTHWVTSVAFSPDSKHIISGSYDESVRIWDVSTGNVLKELKGHTYIVTSVAFSPDGNHIVSGSDDKSVRIWDISTGNKLKEPKDHTNMVTSIVFSPDDNLKHIVSSNYDKPVQFWGSELLYIRERILDTGQYTGWLLSPASQACLMFVPPQAQLPDFSNILTIPHSASSHVDFTNITFGQQWMTCYHPCL